MGTWLLFALSIYAVPLMIYLAFAMPALVFLRARMMDEVSRAIWALAIVAVPVMRAVAFALQRPGVDR